MSRAPSSRRAAERLGDRLRRASGGSFPIGGHAIYSSDLLGRPAKLQRLHIVDSANFPTVGSSTMVYTIMANADRIARACAELDAA
jgi:choline dehydrogenase-like flavoprotein